MMRPILTISIFACAVSSAAQERPAGPRLPRAKIDRFATEIDRLVERDLAAHGQRPNPIVDDATFLRRAYLTIAGRIPTIEEAVAFLGSRRTDRRLRLVDRLLGAPGYQSAMFHWFADLLRVKSRLNGPVSGEPYVHWLKQAIADNRPYDEMVRELLTASGPAHARGNGATGYFLRDRNMPADNMANTVRVFLGTRLECAQCHDHPFDKWKQKQFYRMLAFTGGLRYRADVRATELGRRLARVGQEARRKYGRNGQRALGRMMRSVLAGISGSGTGVARLPKDYRYDDARPGAPVTAHVLMGEGPRVEPRRVRPRRNAGSNARRDAPPGRRARRGGGGYAEIDSRRAYAEWLTAADNPRFAKVAANRLWKRIFGRGVLEPVDDLRDDSRPANPALMERLEKLMVELDFDLLEFQRVLLSTRLFAREAARGDLDPREPYRFPGPVLRRLSAEQIWDSIVTLAVPEVDATLAPPGQRAEPIYRRYEALANATEQELAQAVDLEVLRFTDPARYRREIQRRRDKGPYTMAMMRTDRARQRARQVRTLRKQLAEARRAGRTDVVAALQRRVRRLGGARDRGSPRGLVRASDLPSPAPPGHFLRQLGQSDREQIEAASTEANVPQVLTMLNGIVETRLLGNPSAPLTTALLMAPGIEDRIRVAYLGILAREPDADELAMWKRDHERVGDAVFRDLVWTLLNTHEFRFWR